MEKIKPHYDHLKLIFRKNIIDENRFKMWFTIKKNDVQKEILMVDENDTPYCSLLSSDTPEQHSRSAPMAIEWHPKCGFSLVFTRLYLPFSVWFGTKQTSIWLEINRKIVNTSWFRFDLIIFRKEFSVCSALMAIEWHPWQ